MTYCLINKIKLKQFHPRSKRDLIAIDVNLRSSRDDAEHSIYLVTELFKRRKNRYHLRFWIGGSFHSKGYLIRECVIENNHIVLLDE